MRCGRVRAAWGTRGALAIAWVLLTGDRRGEWARARWDWLTADWSAPGDPRERVQNGQATGRPPQHAGANDRGLSATGEAGPYLFSSDGGLRAVSGFSKAKARLDRLIAGCVGTSLAPWVVHDLRRSMATRMERIGVEPHIIEVCLGHALKGVVGTYRQYGYLPEKARALQAWADELLPACDDRRETAPGEQGKPPRRGARRRASTDDNLARGRRTPQTAG